MFNNKDKVAIWMEGSLDDDYGKMLWIVHSITLLTGTQQTGFRKLNTCKRAN